MPEGAWFALSFASSFAGMGWLALALDSHWRQVRGSALRPRTRRALRVLGSTGLVLSLLASLIANHPSMAPLVWFMQIAAAALLVAMLLAWRPRVLNLLVPRAARD